MPLCYFYDSYYCIVRSWHSIMSGAPAFAADCKISTHFGMFFSFCKTSLPKENQQTSDPDSWVRSLQPGMLRSGLAVLLPTLNTAWMEWDTEHLQPIPKHSVQVKAPLSERHPLCCQLGTSSSHWAVLPIFPALISLASLHKTQTSVPRTSSWTPAISCSSGGRISPVSLHCSQSSQMLLEVPPLNGSFSYNSTNTTDRSSWKPRGCICASTWDMPRMVVWCWGQHWSTVQCQLRVSLRGSSQISWSSPS